MEIQEALGADIVMVLRRVPALSRAPEDSLRARVAWS